MSALLLHPLPCDACTLMAMSGGDALAGVVLMGAEVCLIVLSIGEHSSPGTRFPYSRHSRTSSSHTGGSW